jgi:hypothetical protein
LKGGLNRYNSQTGQFEHFKNDKDNPHSLSNDTIRAIFEDSKGRLWLGTNDGLSHFEAAKISFKNYDFNDGLQGNGFNQRAYFKAKDGELFFGGSNGFNRFYPQDISDDPHRPTVVLTDFLVANQSVAINPRSILIREERASDTKNNSPSFELPQSIDSLDHLTLSYQQSLITFEFAALHFVNQMKNQFAYQLLGQDPNWITTDAKNRRATYSNLAAGHYTLRIKASNKDGYWNEQGKTLSIEVLPPHGGVLILPMCFTYSAY